MVNKQKNDEGGGFWLFFCIDMEISMGNKAPLKETSKGLKIMSLTLEDLL